VQELQDLRSQVDELKRQNDALRNSQKNILAIGAPNPEPQSNGPIAWDSQLTTWTSGDQDGTLFLGIGVYGRSTGFVEFTDAYVLSGLTGEKQTLLISTGPGPQLASIHSVNIPADVRVELWLKFDHPIHAVDLLQHWGKFIFHAEYSGVTYAKTFDENFMTNFAKQFPGSNIGPHITKKLDAK
jgi:hypothetical protein